MANGKPGDHPLTDILVHRLPVFSPKIDEMIREIERLGGRAEVLDKIAWFESKSAEFEDEIRTSLALLRDKRGAQGWELD